MAKLWLKKTAGCVCVGVLVYECFYIHAFFWVYAIPDSPCCMTVLNMHECVFIWGGGVGG